MTEGKLKSIITTHKRQDLSDKFNDFAVVSLIIANWNTEPEIAFIRRALNPNDAWSGQIAFPGGRKNSSEESDLAAALRETLEEVGWQVPENSHFGFLSDIQARNKQGYAPFFLRPLVFLMEEKPTFDNIDPEEVDEVFWIPLSHLKDPGNTTSHFYQKNNLQVEMPAIKLSTGDKLWGLTYFICQEFMQLIKDLK